MKRTSVDMTCWNIHENKIETDVVPLHGGARKETLLRSQKSNRETSLLLDLSCIKHSSSSGPYDNVQSIK